MGTLASVIISHDQWLVSSAIHGPEERQALAPELNTRRAISVLDTTADRPNQQPPGHLRHGPATLALFTLACRAIWSVCVPTEACKACMCGNHVYSFSLFNFRCAAQDYLVIASAPFRRGEQFRRVREVVNRSCKRNCV